MTFVPLPVDSTTGAVLMIDYGHHEIHSGGGYMMCLVDLSMAITEYIAIGFTTPAAAIGISHMTWIWRSKAAAHLDLVEGATLTTGTAATPYNRNRNSANTSAMVAPKSYDSAGGDVAAGGTIIKCDYSFAAKAAGGGGGREAEEVKIKAATAYAIRVTADANANAAYLHLSWYEHIDK